MFADEHLRVYSSFEIAFFHAPNSYDRSTRAGTNSYYDLVLSSGFLAFANHAGFIAAVEDVSTWESHLPPHGPVPCPYRVLNADMLFTSQAGLKVAGVMGTSAGALAGSLYCAGYTPRQVAAELSRDPPIQLLNASRAPWQGGLLSLDPVIERLRDLLPPNFEDLEREFAVGVVDAQGRHMIIDRGPLPEAVAASAAIPMVFESVNIPGEFCIIGC